MATSTASSSSLTRYSPWVWALTGLTTAYCTYTIWTAYSSPANQTASNNSGLQRRRAIRAQRRRSPRQEQHLSTTTIQASRQQEFPTDDTSSPFGTITAQVNDRQHVYQIGPTPPTLRQLHADFHLSGAALQRIYAEMQTVLLDMIIDRLLEPNAETFLSLCSPTYSSLVPLIQPLRERNIEDLLDHIHLLGQRSGDGSDLDMNGEWAFDQANVALAFARRCHVDVERTRDGQSLHQTGLDGLDDDLAETVVDSEAGVNAREPGQGIKGLIYTIAEEQAKRSAYVHRGTRCDSCGEFPIRGVRWHCINCPDYDLCSNCEAQTPNVHPRTHVFAKIKIPISTLAQPHQVHDLWYPGDPRRYWPALKVSLRKRLVSETGLEDVAIEAYYEQFTCIANVAYPDDPTDIRAAIDFRAFRKATSSAKWPPLEPNFLYDRMFNFYDTDNDSLIGFEEFVHGLAYLRPPVGSLKGKRKNMHRVFLGYDVDGDGLLSRSDFVRMYSAKYALQKHIIRDVIATEEADIAAHTMDVVRSSQPLSAAFNGEEVPPGERRVTRTKTMDEFGDLQPTESWPLSGATLPDDSQVWDNNTIRAVALRYRGLEDTVRRESDLGIGHAHDMRERYDRVESVPIARENESDNQEVINNRQRRYLVETDSRQTRGRTDIRSPEDRWAADLNDAVAGGASGSSNTQLNDNDEGAVSPNRDGQTDLSAERRGEVAIFEDDGQDAPYPDFILNRGRAYSVPEAERENLKDVLYQVTQEGINELIDPIFFEREKLAEDVRATRAERARWRKQIDEFKRDIKTFTEELSAGALVDPLMATALASREYEQRQTPGRQTRMRDRMHGLHGSLFDSDSDSGSDNSSVPPLEGDDEDEDEDDGNQLPSALSINESDVAWERGGGMSGSHRSPRTPHDIAGELHAQLQQQGATLPTDDEGLEDLEFNIRHSPLDALLESAGYSVASPVEERSQEEANHENADDQRAAVSTSTAAARDNSHVDEESHAQDQAVQNGHLGPSQEELDEARGELSPEMYRMLSEDARTLSPNLPVQITDPEEAEQGQAEREADEAMRLSPSSPPTPLLPSSLDWADSSSATPSASVNEGEPSEAGDKQDGLGKGKEKETSTPPSTARLEYLCQLDEEERRILLRGGPGRLTFDEVEEICRKEPGLMGLAEGWLEWAGF